MKLDLYRALWGFDLPWERAFPIIARDGYAGVECPMPAPADRARFLDLLAASGLSYIAMAFTSGADVDAHVDSLRVQLDTARALNATQVTAHSGVDAWRLDRSEAFFARAIDLERAAGIPVAHETHRGRTLFNPWVTRDLLASFADLKLCCDLSHWTCVAERLDWDDGGIVALCAERCRHLHARVGYANGPQVPDPTAPEYANEVATHEQWWDAIWAAQAAAGRAAMTVTPEFGPPGYLHALPHTNVPVADLTRVVAGMATRLRDRYRDAPFIDRGT